MKKILNFGCGAIAYNEKYIAVAGNKIGLIDRATSKVCGTLTGKNNVTDLEIKDRYAYVKTTLGVYYMFDLTTQQLQCNGYCREKKNSNHDGKLYVYTTGTILDVLSFKDDQYYFVKYDFTSRKCEKVCVAKSDFSCKDWWIDYQKRRAYILFLEKCCLNHPKTNCYISVVNIDNFEIEVEMPIILEHGIMPIGLINTQSILLNNMEIYDIFASAKKALDSDNYFKDASCGYFVRMNSDGNRNLILIFSKCVFVFDLITKKLCQSYACRYGDNAICIDGKIYIATWDGLFLSDVNQGTVNQGTEL